MPVAKSFGVLVDVRDMVPMARHSNVWHPTGVYRHSHFKRCRRVDLYVNTDCNAFAGTYLHHFRMFKPINLITHLMFTKPISAAYRQYRMCVYY